MAATATQTETHNAVVLWRYEELVRAGYPEREALQLALRRDVDLHTAVKLIQGGCLLETAIRILD